MLQRHAIKNKWRRVQRPIGICEPTKKRAHIAFCLNDGSVYSESYSNSPVHPASLTKLMTLCIALDLLKSGRLDLEEDIIFSRRSQKFHSPNSGFKSATFNDVLNLICVASANDAAVAVAEHIGRTEWRFCHEFMNPKARSLGMKNSEFWNATGLLNHDLPYSRPLPHSVTTASDLMVLVS
ncbi:MAG: serine hydrolase, partial [Pseudomonadota bacterium]